MPSRLFRTVAVLVAATIVVGTGVAWGKIRSFESGINHIFSDALGGGGEDGAIDILLVGMDSRTDAHGNPLSEEELATLRAGDDEATNTDTIILVRIPNNGKSATAISIPRDSYVEAPGIGKMKINGVYGSVHLEKLKKLVEQQGVDPAVAEPEATEAGREVLIKTVANLTGVTVDHYAEIGLLGFALITDALGGVNICLKDNVYEPLSGADFSAGWQKLDGPQALSFVRQRHDLPRGDLDRVVRQQVVMASLAHEVMSGKTLSSPATLGRLQDAILHWPGHGLAVGHLPGAGVGAAAEQHGRVGRGATWGCARRDHLRLRPRAIMDMPLAVWLHGRVVVANLGLLG